MCHLNYLRHIVLFFLALLIACQGEEVQPETDKPYTEKPETGKPNETGKYTYPTPVSETAYAFPGAYGGGMHATGGRGGKVIKVTTPDANGRHLSTAYDNIEVYLHENARKNE